MFLLAAGAILVMEASLIVKVGVYMKKWQVYMNEVCLHYFLFTVQKVSI